MRAQKKLPGEKSIIIYASQSSRLLLALHIHTHTHEVHCLLLSSTSDLLQIAPQHITSTGTLPFPNNILFCSNIHVIGIRIVMGTVGTTGSYFAKWHVNTKLFAPHVQMKSIFLIDDHGSVMLKKKRKRKST
jgi:hypothetical protein